MSLSILSLNGRQESTEIPRPHFGSGACHRMNIYLVDTNVILVCEKQPFLCGMLPNTSRVLRLVFVKVQPNLKLEKRLTTLIVLRREQNLPTQNVSLAHGSISEKKPVSLDEGLDFNV